MLGNRYKLKANFKQTRKKLGNMVLCEELIDDVNKALMAKRLG